MTTDRSEDPQAGDPGELLGVEAAGELLGVQPDQVRSMADQGILTAHDGADGPRFQRAELIAARDLGG